MPSKKSWNIPKNKECARALNTLAREELKLRLLADIRIDIQICQLEGWDYKEYLLELKKLIDSFLKKKKSKKNIFDESQLLFFDFQVENFLCVFLDNGKELEDYFILLIPNAFLNQKDTVHVSKSGAWFNNFQVSKEELKGILDMYVETLNMSKERTD